MLVSLEKVVAEIAVGQDELRTWIERSWVLPVKRSGGYFFDDADLARARLIAELRRDMDITEEAMPVVLRLLDQVYGLRRALSDLNRAISVLPEDARETLRTELERLAGNAEKPD